MATTSGAARVAAINQAIASQGNKGYSTAPNPTGGGNAVTSSTKGANPYDMPSYNPASDPASTVNTNPLTQKTVAPELPTPVNTSQPSPSTAVVTPPNSNLANAVAGKGSALTSAEMNNPQVLNDLATKYKNATALANKSGIAPSQSTGTAMADTNQFMGAMQGQQETPSVIGGIIETDSNFDSILTMYDDFHSPLKQRQTLLQEYQSMSKNLGIEGMNAELINAKRVIEGTEDDIRSEITGSGGLATDSLVMALGNARNKSLIRNYNYLLESRDSAMTQLNTMMNLSIQDRQMAESEFDRKLGFAFKVAEFKERAVNNARDGYNNIVRTSGWGGLLAATNGDQYQQSMIEKSMGLASGGLSRMATYTPPMTPEEKLRYQNLQLQNQKLQQDIKGGGSLKTEVVDVNGRKVLINSQTGETIKDIGGGFGGNNSLGTPGSGTSLVNPTTGRADPRTQIANIITSSGAKTDDKLKLTGAVVSAAQALAEGNRSGSIKGIGAGQLVPSIFLNQKGQDNRTNLSALTGTVESWMTGASVSKDQEERIKRDLIPKISDTDGQVRRKVNALANYMMNYASGSLSTQGVSWTPETIDFFSNPVVVGPDGEEYEFTN